MKAVILSSILFLLLACAASGKVPTEGVDCFQQGDFSAARNILRRYLSNNPTDIEALLYIARLEPEGKQSASYLKEILEVSGDFRSEDQVLLGLCQYNFSKGFYLGTVEIADKFEKKFKGNPYHAQVIWFCASALLAMGETQKACEKYIQLSSFSDYDMSASAEIGKADCLFADGKFSSAINQYKKTIERFEDSDVLPLTLIQISSCYAQMNEKDKSLLYYSLYREKYPHGMMVEEKPKDTVSVGQPEKDKSHKAEDIINVEYTIQLGVFGVKENANRLSAEFKAKGYVLRIVEKTIDQKRYYVVQLGRFRSHEEARKIREKLEKETGESYRVVLK